ncbi:hypothetical protein WAJ74_22425, partial [Acinetobacter baumannii]
NADTSKQININLADSSTSALKIEKLTISGSTAIAGKTEKVTITAEDIKAAEEDIKAFTQAQEGLANLVKEVKDTDGS